ncbi:MAG: ferrous iron transport protein B [Gammaproteobacteria bacterium]
MSTSVHRVPLGQIEVLQRPEETIVLVGNPNAGKSTLFNRLTGLRQKTANYPGVTVEKRSGRLKLADKTVELVDLPGTYALSAEATDERIAVQMILGRLAGTPAPSGVLVVVDGTRLYQGLYLVQQLAELQVPMACAVTMLDVARVRGVRVDLEALSNYLGMPVLSVTGTTGQGIDGLTELIGRLPSLAPPKLPLPWPELRTAATRLSDLSDGACNPVEIQRILIDQDTQLASDLAAGLDSETMTAIATARQAVFGDEPPLATEARRRYGVMRQALGDIEQRSPAAVTFGARVWAQLNRPLPATLGFFAVMAVVFQAVFSWATPFMDAIDAATAAVSRWLALQLPEGMLASLLVDGVVAGVGSVIIFLPQILMLFLFIVVLEDSGYLARAAFLMDRAMRSAGLSGQSVIPMLSSFACAIPGIMATRVIPNRRDRIATIIAAPFMTCSARLPVYALLIAAFVPRSSVGLFNLQGLVLFGLYMLGILGGLATALLLRKTALRGPKPTFMLNMPEFCWPNVRNVIIKLLDRVRIFLRRAGTVICAVAIVVWALADFPRSTAIAADAAAATLAAEQTLSGAPLLEAQADISNRAAARQLEQSWLGRAGQVVEPVFAPLGWDWRVSAGVIAGFPAREVVVAVLGTIYAVGGEAEEATLAAKLKGAVWPDGRPVFTLPMVIGLLIFYAWCLQCAATLAVIRRETNSWRWPIFAWVYMTGAGYVGALLAFQLGTSLS